MAGKEGGRGEGGRERVREGRLWKEGRGVGRWRERWKGE